MRLKTTFRSSVKNFLIRQIQGSADDLTEIWRELFKLIDNDDGQLTAQVSYGSEKVQPILQVAGAGVNRGELGCEHQRGRGGGDHPKIRHRWQ